MADVDLSVIHLQTAAQGERVSAWECEAAAARAHAAVVPLLDWHRAGYHLCW